MYLLRGIGPGRRTAPSTMLRNTNHRREHTMARDTSNDPVVNLPLDYKFDGNGNIIQKVFFLA